MIIVKSNFKKDNDKKFASTKKGKNLTKEEFEKFMIESGAAGSFMIYRSKNKDNEMGLDEL